MINGFEEETKELNHEELKLLGYIVHGLKSRIGKENAITSIGIIAGLKRNLDIKINDARLRKLINYIRTQGRLPNLIATSRGYYIENSQEEIDKYVESLYQRSNAIIEVAKSYSSSVNNK